MKKELEAICKLVRSCGAFIKDINRASLSVDAKSGPADLVTQYDRQVQERLRTGLLEIMPDAHFVGEEGSAQPFAQAGKFFIVDPIDGTTNFVKDYRFSGISVALVVDNVAELGVIYNPYADEMFFAGSDKLENEFDELYSSLFRKKDAYMRIVSALGLKKAGMSRGEIAIGARISNSGTLTKYLQELEQCGFIRRYVLPGRKTKDAIYQLMDNFTLFHFKFIFNNVKHDRHFWTSSLDSPFHVAWEGLAFERLCLWHVEQIKRALQIGGVLTNSYAWRHVADSPDDVGAQIDLLIDRNDGIINICEMKFCDDEYAITADDMKAMRRKKAVFKENTSTRKAIHITYVTTFGLKRNAYANDVQSVVTLEDLFR